MLKKPTRISRTPANPNHPLPSLTWSIIFRSPLVVLDGRPMPTACPRCLRRSGPPAGRSGAGDVAPLARVDLELVADVDEQRHLDYRSRLERRRLRDVRDGVALYPRLGLRDLEDDG